MPTSSPRIVLVTHPLRGAKAFARRLVELRLAACVNLVALESTYRWRGKIESAREIQLVIKTRAARVPALERHVGSEHPYDTPEFLVVSPRRAGERYLRWLQAETGPGPRVRSEPRRRGGRVGPRRRGSPAV